MDYVEIIEIQKNTFTDINIVSHFLFTWLPVFFIFMICGFLLYYCYLEFRKLIKKGD